MNMISSSIELANQILKLINTYTDPKKKHERRILSLEKQIREKQDELRTVKVLLKRAIMDFNETDVKQLSWKRDNLVKQLSSMAARYKELKNLNIEGKE